MGSLVRGRRLWGRGYHPGIQEPWKRKFVISSLASEELPARKQGTADRPLPVQNEMLAEFLPLSALGRKYTLWPLKIAFLPILYLMQLKYSRCCHWVSWSFHRSFFGEVPETLDFFFSSGLLWIHAFSSYVYSYCFCIGFWENQDMQEVCFFTGIKLYCLGHQFHHFGVYGEIHR